jgi:hypothetical protein
MKKIDLDKIEPLMLNDKPEGQNGMSARASFMQKKLYEKVANNISTFKKNKPIDIWYERLLYGRIDQFHNTVQVKQDRMKQIIQPEDTVLALDFVADAFADFADFWAFLNRKNVLEVNSPYAVLRLKKGWEDLNVKYYDIMGIYYDKLLAYIQTNQKDKKITSFESFLQIFVEFLDLQTPFFPILRSTVNTSRYSNPNVSGIVLDLKTEDFSDDKIKMTKYLEDPNFTVFKETAQKYGFLVDKHAPWRIFADMASPAMKPYMDKYGATIDNFFELYFDKLIYPDLDLLKLYVIQMYNAYITAKPTVQEPTFIICNGRTKLRLKQTIRETTTKEIVELQVPEETWIRFYAFIKAREQNLNWTQPFFEQVVLDTLQFKAGLNMQAAMTYLDKKTKIPLISKQKERSFRF